jgi:hypothetical protein
MDVSRGLLFSSAKSTGPAVSSYVAVSNSTSPFVGVYPWDNTTGFGALYSNPATLPVDSSYGLCWNSTSTVLMVTFTSAPRVYAYPWSSSGFGAVYSNPATALLSTPPERTQPSFSIPGTAIAFPGSTTPFVRAYSWSDSTGFGAAYSAPATALPDTGLATSFHPSNGALAVAHYGSPFISAYPWSEATGYGTKYSNPASLPSNISRSVDFNPSGTAVAVGHTRTTGVFGISVYLWDNTTGFGAKYSNPASFTNIDHNSVKFSPNSDFIVASLGGSTQKVGAWDWNDSTGFGTYYNPAVRPDNTNQAVSISADGLVVAATAFTTGNRIFAWPFTPGVGFGTVYSAPATALAGTNRNIAFSPT